MWWLLGNPTDGERRLHWCGKHRIYYWDLPHLHEEGHCPSCEDEWVDGLRKSVAMNEKDQPER